MAKLNDGRNSVDRSANYTLVDTDAGNVQNVVADGKTITLPAAAAGKRVTIRVAGAGPSGAPAGAASNKSAGVTISRAGTDTTNGLGATGTTVTLAKSAMNVGDEVTLQAVGTAWHVVHSVGAWVVA